MKKVSGKTAPSATKSPRTKKKSNIPAIKAEVSKVARTHKPDDLSLEEWQRLLRKQFGERQEFGLDNLGDHPLFADFNVTNPESGRTYRVAIRGDKTGENFCACPDFAVNTLGTCKHIEFTLARLNKKRGAAKQLAAGFTPPYSEVFLSYREKKEVRFRAGSSAPAALVSHASRFFDENGVLRDRHLLDLHLFLQGLSRWKSHEVRCYDDVLRFAAIRQDAAHRQQLAEQLTPGGVDDPLFDTLLKTELYPYQRQGALFALRTGRCLIGDDMGLGKTIQALAAAELMARCYGVTRVLIISPTSLKHQWQGEIDKFTGRSAVVIEGLTPQRRDLYGRDSFFKLANYEIIHRDLDFIREWQPDLIILDEAQRIKNWKTRIAQTIKRLDSTFAIVLTGTPLENRIEELHSLMEFVDREHLGPLYRFVHNHRVTDAHGKVIGYRDLAKVRHSLKEVMIRRRKSEVLRQLPGRIDKNFFVPMTVEQSRIHADYYDMVVQLVAKWRRFRFLCEADQRRLQMALASMRMVSDNTWLIDKKSLHGPKLAELEIILNDLMAEGKEKAVVFSQWQLMTSLVAKLLDANGIGYVHLNGSVPSKERKGLMTRFRDDPDCRVFLSTDAGGVGLNLQSGSLLVNLDIPWNPAVLEQRIARIHRMGQKKPVRIINFISRGSIEERILALLGFKKSLSAGALDEDGHDVVMLGESQMEQFMSSVEEATSDLERQDREAGTAQLQEEELAAAEAAVEPEPQEEEAAPVAAGATAERDDSATLHTLHTLLASGAKLLQSLSEALAAPPQQSGAAGQPGEQLVQRLVARDEATGKPYLKIPMPEPETVNAIVSGLAALFGRVM